jgi:hypothetical protein
MDNENIDVSLKMQFWNNKETAFIKEEHCNGQLVWAIYNSLGEKLAETESKEFGFWLAKQNNLDLFVLN